VVTTRRTNGRSIRNTEITWGNTSTTPATGYDFRIRGNEAAISSIEGIDRQIHRRNGVTSRDTSPETSSAVCTIPTITSISERMPKLVLLSVCNRRGIRLLQKTPTRKLKSVIEILGAPTQNPIHSFADSSRIGHIIRIQLNAL